MATVTEGVINHFGAIRLRATGSGSLKMKLLSLDDVNNNEMVSLTMSATTNRELTRLCNFSEQRAYLELKTVNKDEYFIISKIVVYTKPVASEFPG